MNASLIESCLARCGFLSFVCRINFPQLTFDGKEAVKSRKLAQSSALWANAYLCSSDPRARPTVWWISVNKYVLYEFHLLFKLQSRSSHERENYAHESLSDRNEDGKIIIIEIWRNQFSNLSSMVRCSSVWTDEIWTTIFCFSASLISIWKNIQEVMGSIPGAACLFFIRTWHFWWFGAQGVATKDPDIDN